MKATPWMNSVLLAALLCSGSALAADADAKKEGPAAGEAATLQKSSDAAVMGDKDGCPVHEGAMGSMHKGGEPCPYMKDMGKPQEGCDVRDKKDCMETNGKPCRSRHDMQSASGLHEACDPAKGGVKAAK